MADDRPIRMLFATDVKDLAGCIALLMEFIIKPRPVTLVEHLDLADLAADARQFACDLILIWCNGTVRDRERTAGTYWRDYVPRAAKLRSEFPAVPVIMVSTYYGPDFPGRVAEAGAHLLKTPFSFEDFKTGFETWRSVGCDRSCGKAGGGS